MDASLSLISPAKLNLFLHINGRRGPDQSHAGYHELQTYFQILDRGDLMHFSLPRSEGISITPEFSDIPTSENLVYRAATLLQEAALLSTNKPISQLGAHIHLEKNLPMGGGVGGGSSNAATTLLALNYLWHLNFSEDQLAKLGARLGADVPVFVRGRSAWAEGIGDEITPINQAEKWYVVLSPDCHVSTPEIFSHERLTRDSPKKKIAPALEGQSTSNRCSEIFSEHFRNDFEALISELYPEIQQAINWLSQYGVTRLTGTGACCFCLVDSEQRAKQVLNEARSKFKGFIAKGVNLSPAIQRLDEAKRFARNHF
jgi:4-diphosphocytidyl-2-C-methyl-D-erythritol kinase